MSERPLRVAIFTETYLPYLSGVTVSTDALARGLARAGHEVLLVAPAPPPAAIVEDPPDRLRIAWLPSYQGPPPAPRGYRMPWPISSAALRAAVAFEPEIVHAHSPFVSGLMARRIARHRGVPLVFTNHTRFADYRHYLGPLATPGTVLLTASLQRWWANCTVVVAPGSELAAEISAQLRPGRRPLIRTIPTGVELAHLAALPRRDPRHLAGWPAAATVVVSVGRLAPEKNLATLMEAFALAARRDPNLRLLLIGGGPSQEWAAVRSGAADLAGRVHLTGTLPRDEALALASGADLFAFASQTETQGLVLAEALSVGLPVVALDGPGVQDTVRDGVDGMLVKSHPAADAAERLAAAMTELMTDVEHRTRLASEARSGARRFDVATRISEMESLYHEVRLLRAQGRLR